jgi:hypothetical protein
MATNNVINTHGPQPVFFVTIDATKNNVTGDGTAYTIPFNTVVTDTTTSWDTVNYQYIAPTTGKYFITALVHTTGVDAGMTEAYLLLRTTGSITFVTGNQFSAWAMANSDPAIDYQVSAIISLTAAQTVNLQLTVSGGAKIVNVVTNGAGNTRTWISGYLIR